ncbi:fumarylacetoacetase [Saccharopolyspora antimicrobica]|uniref:fumarylacetoacetase n=1 Tax=Saccharopolyspora antimicrobica TaxID=455193 RepID=A0A1I4X1Z8_9PSEU|nr:fumarylacetoacetate hydrolase family protein [Saccharopolyspora antimicrobica]RKT84278.1 fumarylacetoacetase [Saccharopolyspora antimicrobica]SFN20031.1 fumarylacetoacetase [Saccharopolyspora antimicrobica]
MTWIEDPEFAPDQPFGPQTLPYGVLVTGSGPVVAVRVGRHALPLRGVAEALGPRLAELVSADSLDTLLAAGRERWQELRERLTEIVSADRAPAGARLVRTDWHTLVLPFAVADYVDFFSSRHHVENVNRILRRTAAPVPENWTHMPVGYHGRAGTVYVSGTDIHRPSGQRKAAGDLHPAFGPTRRLDFEAEVGFVCGGEAATRVPTADFAEHVFGVVLVNDWSARDVQAWESEPLGPFLAKSFATSMAGWITPLAAFEDARIPLPEPDHVLQSYLLEAEPWGLDLQLEVRCNETVLSRPRFEHMSWSPAQQLAHLTVNGAPVRPGDLFASGTVSGPQREQRGCLLELTWGGAEPITLQDGEQRTFLQDGDRVTLRGTAPGPGGTVIGLGEVTGTVLAAARR